MSDENAFDVTIIVGICIVFMLPLTLLIPNFNIWNQVPKVHLERFHVIAQEFSWLQINISLICLQVLLFCLYLELRKRKLDDMVEKVLTVNQSTDATMEVERDRQATTLRLCVELLDTSADHYENLVLLRDELRKREKLKKQYPPMIELSSNVF